MKWIFLLIAGMLEISRAVSLKFIHGFSRVASSVVTVGLMAAVFIFLHWLFGNCRLELLMRFEQESEF